ncbi:hypothetical protein WR25_19187 [Diploscapter pachys]|uniref:DNA polymerase n=1 Tax=Diploscapter pachys TaxID=2018661 RepID=A0A2A2JEZ9_9BILA|nr:hypothetical protein WR25_19187 [Diploscapter pachys]
MSTDPPAFSLRNVFCEYSLTPPNPISEKVIKTKRLVPTLHIFGISDEGTKVCLHVHGVLPYVIFRVGGDWTEAIKSAMKQKIDRLIQKEYPNAGQMANPRSRRLPSTSAVQQPDYVFSIEPLRCKTMYGYTENDEQFAKVKFLNPIYVNKLMNSIDRVITTNPGLQPFEAHIPYHLQFFIDYAIFGMDMIHLSSCRFRIAQGRELTDIVYRGKTVSDIRNDPSLLSPLLPITSCAVEIDIVAHEILNPILSSNGKYSLNPGIDFIWREEERRCKEFGTQIKDPFKDCMEEDRPRPVSDQEKDLLKKMRDLARQMKEQRQLQVDGVYTQALNDTVYPTHEEEPEPSSGRRSALFWSQAFVEPTEPMGTDQNEEPEQNFQIEQENGDEDTQMGRDEEDEINAELEENDEQKREEFLMTQPIGRASSSDQASPHLDINEDSNFPQSDDDIDIQNQEKDDDDDQNSKIVPNLPQKKEYRKSGITVKRHKMVYRDQPVWVRPKNRLPLKKCDFEWDPPEENNEEVDENDVTIVADSQNPEDGLEEARIEEEEEPLEELNPNLEVQIEDSDDDVVPATQEPGPSWMADPAPSLPAKRARKLEIEKPRKQENQRPAKREERETSNDSMLYANSDDSFNMSDYNEFFRKHSMDTTTIYEQSQVSDENTNSSCESEISNFGVISLELFCYTTGLMPDPATDPITAAAVSIYPDICRDDAPQKIIVFHILPILIEDKPNIRLMNSEAEIIDNVVRVVKEFDPELLIGYDTKRLSWGYLLRRSYYIMAPGVLRDLSRYLKADNPSGEYSHRRDDGDVHTPGGRSLIDVWKIVRKDQHLRSYDRGTATLGLLKTRFPILDDRALTKHIQDLERKRTLEVIHYVARCAVLDVKLLQKMNWFLTTAEMARVYGIQLHEVLTRGSQYRIESMMLRLAHSLGYIAPSVTKSQRSSMVRPEQIALILEPESKVYYDPIIVLDFQSLYPSMSIAYNYCFSTLVGKVRNLESFAADPNYESITLGALQHDINPSEIIRTVADKQVHCTPQRSAFVTRNKRMGIIPIMLKEILSTRFMVKSALKQTTSKKLARILDARQLAMKLVANTTYGYAAANWTGRMPCPEVADAMLGKGRETLERAIELVRNGGEKYDFARVVYGDTDSLFILVPDASLERAFELGKQIAADVTNVNPAPVVLKFEKVYLGCVLESKKRYSGLMFEKLTDTGKIDSKGIETVRRDTCPIVSKILEHSMRLIFERRFQKLASFLNRKLMSLHDLPYTDFVFCKEYRPPYNERSLMPQNKIVQARMEQCPAYRALRGERIPYIVVEGAANQTVYSCVRSVNQFVANPKLRINVAYYTNSHILAALRRVTDLLPLQVVVVQQRARHCFTPGCHVIGQRPWCIYCARDPKMLTLAIWQYAKEQRVRFLTRQACQECRYSNQFLYGEEIESCTNHACVIKQVTYSI